MRQCVAKIVNKSLLILEVRLIGTSSMVSVPGMKLVLIVNRTGWDLIPVSNLLKKVKSYIPGTNKCKFLVLVPNIGGPILYIRLNSHDSQFCSQT